VLIKVGNKLEPDSTALNLFCEAVYKVAKVDKARCIRDNLEAEDEDDDVDMIDEDNEAIVNFSNLELTATDIYETVVSLNRRLQLTASLIHLLPDLERKLQVSPSDHFDLDVQAINIAFDSFVPKGSDVLDLEARSQWASKITTLSTYFKQIEGLLAKDQNARLENREMLTETWKKCQRAKIIKLFFDHVLHKDVDDRIKESVCNNLRLLWCGLKDLDFTARPKTFTNILECINSYCRRAGEVFTEHFNQECIVCSEALINPVSLPCGHVGCQKCVDDYFQSRASRICPMDSCKKPVPDDFTFQCSVEMKKAIASHADFRKKLNEFFIELLQRFVFQKEASPHHEIVDQLLSFIVTKRLPSKPRTKNLSPFPGDFIDAKPVIRSFVLQLLVRYNLQTIEVNLKKFMDEKQPFLETFSQLPELCIMVVQCLEDSFMANERKHSSGNSYKINSAIQHMRSQLEKGPTEDLVKSLCNTALDRLAINTVGDCITNFLSGETELASASDLIKAATSFVACHSQANNLKNYLVRYIASKHQVGAVVEWKKRGIFLDLLPEQLKNSATNEVPDMYLLIDPDYKAIRDGLRIACLSGNYEQLSVLPQVFRDKPLIWALAVHHLTQVNPCQIKDPPTFDTFLAQNDFLSNIWNQRNRPALQILGGQSHRHDSLRDLLMHFVEVVSSSNIPNFLSVIKELATVPRVYAGCFLPTMPQDEALEAKEAVRDARSWYTCSRGHTYAIGDCGRPNQVGVCPDCKEPIGGQNHAFVRNGTNVANLTDQTKPGHVLGEAKSGSRSLTVRETGGLEVALIRFILHSAMLQGIQSYPDHISRLIDPVTRNPEEFLVNHLLLNLRQISDCLRKSENEAILLLHQIIARFDRVRHIQGDWRLNTKASVRKWEEEFVKYYVQPCLADLENFVGRQRIAVQVIF